MEQLKAAEVAMPKSAAVELSETEKKVAYYRNVAEYVQDLAEGLEADVYSLAGELDKAKQENARKDAVIDELRITVAKQRREIFGTSSEHGSRLQDEPALPLEQLEQAIPDDNVSTEAPIILDLPERAAIERKKPSRKPFPAHLPRERVVVPSLSFCECCGGTHLKKLGEDITETLEVIPETYKVIQTVREKFSCRDSEAIGQPPAPFHAIPRGRIGPQLLAKILHEKYGQHQPLNRMSDRFAQQGVDLSTSTLADMVGASCNALKPLFELLEAHILAGERLHGDDTTVPVLAKGKTKTGRFWTYVRDDKPFHGPAPPAAVFYYSPDRKGEHPQAHLATYEGILQADAYSGYGHLYSEGRIIEAGCWAHARRKFFELKDIPVAKDLAYIQPIAASAVRRIDAMMAVDRSINGSTAENRQTLRQEHSAGLVVGFGTWMHGERQKLSRHSPAAKAMDYMLKRWPSFIRFLDDGRICMTNNAAERAIRGIALGRNSWMFAGSDRGADRAAMIYSLIVTAKLNGVDPQAWLADVLARIAGHTAKRLDELLPWNWKAAE